MAIHPQQPDNVPRMPTGTYTDRVALHWRTGRMVGYGKSGMQVDRQAIGHAPHGDGLPVGIGLESKRVYEINRGEIETVNHGRHRLRASTQAL
jgi:hypothetical protein